jgi:hypothetical protein
MRAVRVSGRPLTPRAATSAAGLMVLALLGCTKTEAPRVGGVGDRLQAFMTQASPDTKNTCWVCEYSGQPTLLAIGDPADTAFADDLARIQGMLGKRPDVKAFAVASRFEGGKVAPFPDHAAALQSVAALRDRLGLTFPVVVIPRNADDYVAQGYQKFDVTYRVAAPRMVLFAGPDGKVRWAEALRTEARDAQLAALDLAVAAAL